MLLSRIQNIITCKKIYNLKKKDFKINNIATNSKNINKNSIFIIDFNKKIKSEYIQESINRGAKGVIANKYIKNLDLPQFIVSNINLTIKNILLELKPYKPKKIIAVTGTNGKTSVSWIVSEICRLNKELIKSYGTLGYYVNSRKKQKSLLTTPEFEVLYQKSHTSQKKNNYNFIFEASSHAISQNRINKLPINIAAITNISQDHFDYHKNFKNYKKAKINLFTKYLNINGHAIINSNIKNIKNLTKIIKNKNISVVTFGDKKSNIYIKNKNKNVELKIFERIFILKNCSYSLMEIENISCAICCCLCIGLKDNMIVNSLKKIAMPPGRLQLISRLKNNSDIYIDYAHTPDALKNILLEKTTKKYKPNIVFGCGGNRDKSKRFLMGKVACTFANKVYVTDDNPRQEDPEKIRKDIILACPKSIEIPNRKLAIEKAIFNLNKNETLIVAGKGHEKYQIIKKYKKKFDDAKIIMQIVKNL